MNSYSCIVIVLRLIRPVLNLIGAGKPQFAVDRAAFKKIKAAFQQEKDAFEKERYYLYEKIS